MNSEQKLFPEDFLWGASTSAHQVEGNTYNQWTVWELAHAQELAKHAEQRLSSINAHELSHSDKWASIAARATDPNNYVSGRGVDHFSQYPLDFGIAKKLNLNSFRFSIEWSRIEPTEGEWHQAAIDHYKQYIQSMKATGLEPILNIWHWTVPVWFAEKGGFKHYGNRKYFYRFVRKIAKEFAGDVTYIITLNEPNVYTSFSYLTGEWPPQEKSKLSFVRVYWNLARMHRKAYRILKSKHPHLQIGIASQLANIEAKRPHNLLDVITTEWMRYFWNWWFIRRMRKEQDFVGFNYYFTDYYRFGKFNGPDDPKFPTSDLNWYMEPEGLYPLLLRVWDHYKKPIIITENGVADERDQYRQWWLEQTILSIEKALSEGVQVKGYFHWSLLDNFEWAYGWWPKFGLVAVDREHGMKRSVRPSALWLARKIKSLDS